MTVETQQGAPEGSVSGQPAPTTTPSMPEAAPAPVGSVTAPQPAVDQETVPPGGNPPLTIEPAAPVQDVVVEPAKPEPTAYEPIGNPALDAVASIVAAQGFDPVALSDEIFSNGELSVTTVQALESKLGKEQVTLLKNTYDVEIKKVQAAADARNNAVYESVGGKEAWDAIALWTTTPEAGLSKEAAAEYNDMLAQGGVKSLLAAKALKEAYMASPGFTEPTTIVTGGELPPQSGGIQPISRRQYVDDKKKAMRSGDAAAVAQLEARAQFTLQHAPTQWRVSPLS